MRAAVVAIVAAALLPWSQVTVAHASKHPRNFSGYAFDTCDAPSQKAMNRWRTHSKFWAVGIYIAGANRACDAQPHLTRGWVRRQTNKGWRLLPLVVGRQASCSPKGYYRGQRISPDPSGHYRRARRQGEHAARTAVHAARRLGIGRHSVLWFDLEHFDLSNKRCRASAMAFTSAWTRGLHHRKYLSGFYSSASSGIRMVDSVRRKKGDGWATPDYVWIAEWNYTPTLRSGYISKQRWWPHRRVHQYRGGHTERHGGVRINIDSNILSVGKGTRPGKPAPHCKVRVDFRTYRSLDRGDRGGKVRAAQCLLRKQGVYDGQLHGRYTRGMRKAVHRFQHRSGKVRATGDLNRATWTVLLSDGERPLVKVGSGGNAVRRLQRALNASSNARLKIDGVFGQREWAVVRGLQMRAKLQHHGVVGRATWKVLRRGAVVGSLPRPKAQAGALINQLWLALPFSSGATPR